jgi:hypothetical protein
MIPCKPKHHNSWVTLKKYLVIMLCVCNIPLKAQVVKFINNPLQAKYRVYITEKPEIANIWVYKVKKYENAISNGLWFIVENPQLFKNAITLYKVLKPDEADLIVYYTNDSKKAGYKVIK